MQSDRYTVEIIQRRGPNGLAYVYDSVERWNERVCTGPDAVQEATTAAASLNAPSALPDPTVTGPCQMQVTFMCTGEAAGERLIPTSMLPDALIPGPLYAPMCRPCYDHLADSYLAALHQAPQETP